MTEGKTLDEKDQEGAARGSTDYGIFANNFILGNCVDCARYGQGRDCPYHSNLSEMCAIYRSGSSTCPERRPK